MNSKIIYPELSYEIINIAFEVHNTLGPGFVEEIYEESMAHEFDLRGIPYERQKEVIVSYKGRKVGKHRIDLVVDGKIILELKAVSELTDVFRQRTLSYPKATNLKLGLLINFGSSRVQHERIVN